MHYAVLNGNKEICQTLLEHRAHIDMHAAGCNGCAAMCTRTGRARARTHTRTYAACTYKHTSAPSTHPHAQPHARTHRQTPACMHARPRTQPRTPERARGLVVHQCSKHACACGCVTHVDRCQTRAAHVSGIHSQLAEEKLGARPPTTLPPGRGPRALRMLVVRGDLGMRMHAGTLRRCGRQCTYCDRLDGLPARRLPKLLRHGRKVPAHSTVVCCDTRQRNRSKRSIR